MRKHTHPRKMDFFRRLKSSSKNYSAVVARGKWKRIKQVVMKKKRRSLAVYRKLKGKTINQGEKLCPRYNEIQRKRHHCLKSRKYSKEESY